MGCDAQLAVGEIVEEGENVREVCSGKFSWRIIFHGGMSGGVHMQGYVQQLRLRPPGLTHTHTQTNKQTVSQLLTGYISYKLPN